MKCRVCGKRANIRLSAYNTALCGEDFVAFLEKRVVGTIRKYKLFSAGEIPLIAVSGGKDSLSLWYMMNGLGFPSDGVYIDLGIEGYSDISCEKSKEMARRLGRKLYRFALRDALRKGIAEISRMMKRPPCSLCGTVKRYIMNRVCVDNGYTVLATGHNLDDEASALFGNILYWKEEYLWKKDILLEAKGTRLVKKVKPFFLCSEKEIAAYAILRGIDYIYDECPYSAGAKTLLYKGLLNKVEEVSPATKIRFVKGYLEKARKEQESAEESDRSLCVRCGSPSFKDVCNFCQLVEKFGVDEAFHVEVYEPLLLAEAGERGGDESRP